MKIAHFNTFASGGAATAAIRIHDGLNQFGSDSANSEFYFHRGEQPADRQFQQIQFTSTASDSESAASNFHAPKPRTSKLAKYLQRRKDRRVHRLFNQHLATRPPSEETFSMAEMFEPTPLAWPAIAADIVHLHWISFFADYPSFFHSIPRSVPIVWTLHDMNAFTGGCHYSGGCHRFEKGCGHCPQIVAPATDDVSHASLKTKRNTLRRKRNFVVTPSRWLGELAKRSPVWPKRTEFHHINYGLDLDQYRPLDKQEARKQLGIESDAILVGFGAENILNQRKGMTYLIAALEQIRSTLNADHGSHESSDIHPNAVQQTQSRQPQIEGLLFGSGTISESDKLPRLHQMGFVDSIEQQRLIYSAADLFVVPSLEDNQPQVGLEAMACGTPVVGFRTGGISEYVRDGETGLLAEVGDEAGLAAAIIQLSQHAELRQQLGKRARAMMEAEFEMKTQTQRYLDLYQSAAS